MNSGFHSHYCQRCATRCDCAQITHCSRPEIALCPDHAMEEQGKRDSERAIVAMKPVNEMFDRVFRSR